MNGLGKFLSSSVTIAGRKIPYSVLLLVAALIVGLASWFLTRRSQAAGADVIAADSPTPETMLDPQPDQPATLNMVNRGASSAPLTSDNWQTMTNETWTRQGVEFLVAQGVNSSVANGAIARYISGQVLTPEQDAMTEAVVRKFGLPPENVPPASIQTPSTPAAPKPVTLPNNYYRDVSSGQVWEVANNKRRWTKPELWALRVKNAAARGGKLTAVSVNSPSHPLFKLPTLGPTPRATIRVVSKFENI
jgi:hypothetical protein